MENLLPQRVRTGFHWHHRIGDAGMAGSESRSGLNVCLGQQKHHTVPAKLLNSRAAVEVEYVFTVEERSDESVNNQRPTVIDASACHGACVCARLYGLTVLCVSSVCSGRAAQNNLSFGGNWRNAARRCHRNRRTNRSLSPVTVDAEVLSCGTWRSSLKL